jgi:ribosomal protein S19
VCSKLRKEKNAAAKTGEKPRTIKTHHRNMIIVPEMVGSMIGVYNGLNFTQVEVKVSASLSSLFRTESPKFSSHSLLVLFVA